MSTAAVAGRHVYACLEVLSTTVNMNVATQEEHGRVSQAVASRPAPADRLQATRIVQHLVEQEALLADIRRAAKNANVNNIFARDFEELFDKPDSVESIQPDGNGRKDLAQWIDHLRQQTQQSQTPMEQFFAISRSSDPNAVFSSLRMAEMKIPEGVQAYTCTRASLLQLASAQHAACFAARCVSEGKARATSERSKARTEPAQRRTAQVTLAKGMSFARAQSI